MDRDEHPSRRLGQRPDYGRSNPYRSSLSGAAARGRPIDAGYASIGNRVSGAASNYHLSKRQEM
jgi:hypothetical protein